MPDIDLFALEKDLIHPNKWKDLKAIMPPFCQDIIDNIDGEGIGWNNQYGWFVLASCGQGPMLVWMEDSLNSKK